MSAPATLRELLLAEGVPADQVERAHEEGTLPLLALERLYAPEPRFDIEEVAAATAVEPAQICAYWRALGFPEPQPGVPIFAPEDLEMLAAAVASIEHGAIETDVALQLTRVIGAAAEKIATAQVDAISVRYDQVGPAEGGEPASEETPGADDPGSGDQDAAATAAHLEAGELIDYERAGELLDRVPRILEYVWRRHLADAARRRRMRGRRGSGETVLVGFADLVGFTAAVQELPERELAEVVNRFEAIAYDCVGTHEGRVVKMIGDEVMFVADDVRRGAELALDLAARFREDEALSDVRVGLAAGPVLERDGDVYGRVVNLASRIVAVAYPGTVVVSRELHDALADDDGFVFRELRASYLKDIGRSRLWALRRAGDESEERYRRARERRAARREVARDRIRPPRLGGRGRGDDGGVPADEEQLGPVVGDSVEADGGSGATWVDRDVPDSVAGVSLVALAELALAEESELAELVSLDPPTEELELISSELSADLAEIDELREAKFSEVDAEVERKLEAVEEEARRRIDDIENDVEQAVEDAQRRVEEAHREAQRKIHEAEEAATQAQREAARRIEEAERIAFEKAERVAEEAERRRQKVVRDAGRRAQKAGRDALRRMRRSDRKAP